MAATDLIFPGYYYAVGRTLSAVIGGLYCGDYVVSSSGTLTVPINSDPDGNCNGAYLSQFDVGPFDKVTYGPATTALTLAVGYATATIYIPVIIGYNFPSIGKRLPQIKSQGSGLGAVRRSHQYGAMVLNSIGLQIGTNFTDMHPVRYELDGTPPQYSQMFTGVVWDTVDGDYNFDEGLFFMVTQPYPTTIVALGDFKHLVEN